MEHWLPMTLEVTLQVKSCLKKNTSVLQCYFFVPWNGNDESHVSLFAGFTRHLNPRYIFLPNKIVPKFIAKPDRFSSPLSNTALKDSTLEDNL